MASILKAIDSKGTALLKSRTPWEDGAIDVKSSVDGLTQLEVQLVDYWISAWRERIIRANGTKPRG